MELQKDDDILPRAVTAIQNAPVCARQVHLSDRMEDLCVCTTYMYFLFRNLVE